MNQANLITLIVGFSAALVALIGYLLSQGSDRRNAKANSYALALQAVKEFEELPYRIARRPASLSSACRLRCSPRAWIAVCGSASVRRDLARLGVASLPHRPPDCHRRGHRTSRIRIAVQVDMIPAQFPSLLGADPDGEAQHDISVKP
jgi:hypothetical protein